MQPCSVSPYCTHHAGAGGNLQPYTLSPYGLYHAGAGSNLQPHSVSPYCTYHASAGGHLHHNNFDVYSGKFRCTIATSGCVSSATNGSRGTNQAQAVTEGSGHRFIFMPTQPQRMLLLLPHRISILLHQRQRKQMEKRLTQAHDCAEEGSDRKHRWIRDKHDSATHTEKSHLASDTFGETRNFGVCMLTSADIFHNLQSSLLESLTGRQAQLNLHQRNISVQSR